MMKKNLFMFGFAVTALCLLIPQMASAAFIDNGNSTMTDTRTGLSWQQSDDGVTRTWEEALAYCEGQDLAGRTDWRLPNIRELASIVDDSRYNPAIDPSFSCRSSYYWSGSTRANYPDYAWRVDFSNGDVFTYVKSYNYYVRCVRAGPSGSFDTLTFSFISSPHANGAPFSVTITATDTYGNRDSSFDGQVLLSSSAGAVTPSSVTLHNGIATVQVSLSSPGVCAYLTASATGRAGKSNAFTVNGDGLNAGIVRGFVKDTSGNPVSGATVYLENDCHSDTRNSDQNGYFEFRNIPCSEYSIKAQKDVAMSQTFTLKVVDYATAYKELIVSSAASQGKIPILLVPGIMGSSTSDGSIYPSLSEDAPTSWDSAEWKRGVPRGLHDPFDPVNRYHRPGWTELIAGLEPLGYQLDTNLFPVPYDWRMDWDKAAEKYLKPAIEHALERSATVNIVAHSMGGLLVRAYIQGNPERKAQINKFAMVGVPNHGSANPYYMYFGGDPKTADDLNEGLGTFWLDFYSHTTEKIYEAMHNNHRLFPLKRSCTTSLGCMDYTDWDNAEAKKKTRAFYRDDVPTVKGLLPVFPFLSTSSRFFGIDDNRKLKSLNDDFDLEGMDIKIFAGKEADTITNIDVSKPSSMYPYGVPKSNPEPSKVGDGTVPLTSARLDSITFEGGTKAGHSELIYKYRNEIIEFIIGTTAASVAAATPSQTAAAEDAVTAQLSLSFKGAVTPYLIDPADKKVGINPTTDALENTLAGAEIDMDSVSSDLVIANPTDGVYTVQLKGSYERDYRMEIAFMASDGISTMATAGGFNHADTTSFTFSLDSAAENKLLLNLDPEIPADVMAEPYDSGGLKTRLTWDAVADPAVTLYNVYSRQETEPFMSFLTSSVDPFLETEHLWAENAAIPTRFYAVTAVKADGTESFLSEWAENNDRDHDGLTDEEETNFGSSMTNPDSDEDGLDDAEEYLHGTSPVLRDTDGDGYSDSQEVAAGSDPLDEESMPISATGVFRPSNGLIYLKSDNSTGYADRDLAFGIPNDKPIVGDWDGDGIDTIGVYREGAFLLRNSNETGYAEMYFGLGIDGDVPISGKWGLD